LAAFSFAQSKTPAGLFGGGLQDDDALEEIGLDSRTPFTMAPIRRRARDTFNQFLDMRHDAPKRLGTSRSHSRLPAMTTARKISRTGGSLQRGG
jgi:hypothetical protein